jgi:hypothetical protein
MIGDTIFDIEMARNARLPASASPGLSPVDQKLAGAREIVASYEDLIPAIDRILSPEPARADNEFFPDDRPRTGTANIKDSLRPRCDGSGEVAARWMTASPC